MKNEPFTSHNYECKDCAFLCSNRTNYARHLLTRKHNRLVNPNVPNEKTLITSQIYECNSCSFVCSNRNDYSRHLITRKHNRLTNPNENPNEKPAKVIQCKCGKIYKHLSSLCNHKHKCKIVQIQEPNNTTFVTTPFNQVMNDETIDKLVRNMSERDTEKGSMLYALIDTYQQEIKRMSEENRELLRENQQVTREIVKGNQENTQELINKFIELAPKMGNNNITNNDNRQIVTFNYYLENSCKDAETIHDFIHRYAIKCGDFFRENATAIVNGEASLSFNAHKLFFKSLRENPQHMNFVQTSNVHDGIHYVKEREHGEGEDYLTLYGEAEFNKYTDKFRSKGAEISVAVCQVLNKAREDIYNQRKRYCRPEPTDADYSGDYGSYATQFTDDYDDYRREYENSVEYNSDLSHILTRQVFSVLNLFDMDRTEGKATCKEILSASRRAK